MDSVSRRIAERVDPDTTRTMNVSGRLGGVGFQNMTEIMEFAKLMSIADIGVRKHLRNKPGACLAVTMQAVEWGMSPWHVANKSYGVNDQIAYESQLLHAVVLARAPIEGRTKVEYLGEGADRQCRVWVVLRDTDGEIVEYTSPKVGKINPKNSPLWKSDEDQQLFYYSVRAMARRHFPDVLMGVYADDELPSSPTRDITPAGEGSVLTRLAAAKVGIETQNGFDPDHVTNELPRQPGQDTPQMAEGNGEEAEVAEASPEPPEVEDDAFPGDIVTDVLAQDEIPPFEEPDLPAPIEREPEPESAPPVAEKPKRAGPKAAPLPKTPEEYETYCEMWVKNETDLQKLSARWRAERELRVAIGVDPAKTKKMVEIRGEQIQTGHS